MCGLDRRHTRRPKKTQLVISQTPASFHRAEDHQSVSYPLDAYSLDAYPLDAIEMA